jgi:serpin B
MAVSISSGRIKIIGNPFESISNEDYDFKSSEQGKYSEQSRRVHRLGKNFVLSEEVVKKRYYPRILSGFLLSTILLASLSACSPSTVGSNSAKVLQSQTSRNTNPASSPGDMEELVNGNNAFAFDYYQSMRDRGGNMFYSPFSISSALAMTYAGARDGSETQMAQVLHYTLPQERLHAAFNTLDLLLAGTNESAGSEEERQKFQLNVVNSLWGQKDYKFLNEYLDLLALNYGAGLRLVDFTGATEEARQTINKWIEQQTKDKIKNLIPEGGIDSFTRLVLANAIYFKADWTFPFDKNNTQDLPFNLLDGGQVFVPMMSFSGSKNLSYHAGEGFQAVELPYVGDTTSMVILVPETDKFDAFESALNSALMESILAGLEPHLVALTLPKFSFESEFQLKNDLIEMDMSEPFDPDLADFSGMDGTRQLYIGDVFHKAFVAVDEKGTEAAAATAVIMQAMMVPSQEIVLVVDRPFLFFIRERTTGTILFIGRVLNPSK